MTQRARRKRQEAIYTEDDLQAAYAKGFDDGVRQTLLDRYGVAGDERTMVAYCLTCPSPDVFNDMEMDFLVQVSSMLPRSLTDRQREWLEALYLKAKQWSRRSITRKSRTRHRPRSADDDDWSADVEE